MKKRDFSMRWPKPPFYRTEMIAAHLGCSITTFLGDMEDLGVKPHRLGPNGGRIIWHWPTVYWALKRFGCSNIPFLPFTEDQGPAEIKYDPKGRKSSAEAVGEGCLREPPKPREWQQIDGELQQAYKELMEAVAKEEAQNKKEEARKKKATRQKEKGEAVARGKHRAKADASKAETDG